MKKNFSLIGVVAGLALSLAAPPTMAEDTAQSNDLIIQASEHFDDYDLVLPADAIVEPLDTYGVLARGPDDDAILIDALMTTPAAPTDAEHMLWQLSPSDTAFYEAIDLRLRAGLVLDFSSGQGQGHLNHQMSDTNIVGQAGDYSARSSPSVLDA